MYLNAVYFLSKTLIWLHFFPFTLCKSRCEVGSLSLCFSATAHLHINRTKITLHISSALNIAYFSERNLSQHRSAKWNRRGLLGATTRTKEHEVVLYVLCSKLFFHRPSRWNKTLFSFMLYKNIGGSPCFYSVVAWVHLNLCVPGGTAGGRRAGHDWLSNKCTEKAPFFFLSPVALIKCSAYSKL